MCDNAQSLYVIKVARHLTQELKCYNVFLPGKKIPGNRAHYFPIVNHDY